MPNSVGTITLDLVIKNQIQGQLEKIASQAKSVMSAPMTEHCTQVSTEPRLSRLIYRNGICTVGITSDSAICPPKASQTWFTFPVVSATTI